MLGFALAGAVGLLLFSSAATEAQRRPQAASRSRLPLLYVLKSPDVYVGRATDAPRLLSGSTPPEILFGCDPYEAAQENARLCLRFDTIIVNVGAGPLELRYDAKGIAGPTHAQQRIYRIDGTTWDRPAGTFAYDPAHQHFHYQGFAVASLWRSDPRGHRLGTKPIASGSKDGFCLEDLDPYSATAGNPRYRFPEACYPVTQSDGSITQVNGISPGFLDVYDETLTNQSMEISNVPAEGYYLLALSVDPQRKLLLDPRSRTTATELIRLCGVAVDIVGSTNHCGHGAPRAITASAWRSLCLEGWCPQVPRTGRIPFALPPR